MAKTRPFDPAEYLDTPEAVQAYLADAFETNDSAFIADALGVVARAVGMSVVAERAGLNRAQLYRSLSKDGRPELSTVLRVLDAFGLQLAPATRLKPGDMIGPANGIHMRGPDGRMRETRISPALATKAKG